MRQAFIILYDAAGRRRLDSDVQRSPVQERLAFESLKRSGLPADVERAEFYDTDQRSGCLVLSRPSAIAPQQSSESKPKRKTSKTQ